MSARPLARYASLNSFVELGRSLGLDPVRLVREAGLDPASLGLQDQWAPAAAIAELLERAATASGRDDLGLRLAEVRRFSSLGPLTLVVREEPDARSALRILMRYEHLYNEALHVRVTEQEGLATVRVELDLPPEISRQSIELGVGVLYRIMHAFHGPAWRPVSVSLSHARPAGETVHRRMFGPVVKFGQDYDGLCVRSADLDAPNTMSDPVLRGYAQQFLGELETSKEATTLGRVRELVEILLPTGRCSVEHVARSLGVDRRTVHRKLAKEGETFTSVVEATRRSLAEHLVRNPNRTLTEVAELLAFSSHSNFTRWFRSQFGASPSQWRRAGR